MLWLKCSRAMAVKERMDGANRYLENVDVGCYQAGAGQLCLQYSAFGMV